MTPTLTGQSGPYLYLAEGEPREAIITPPSAAALSVVYLDPAPHADKSELVVSRETTLDDDNSSDPSNELPVSSFNDEDNDNRYKGKDSKLDDENDGSSNIEPDHERPEHGDEAGEDSQNSRCADGLADDDAGDKYTDSAAGRRGTRSEQASNYFNFFGLPQEIRDMIYHQFHRLHLDNPMVVHAADQLTPMETQLVATKPITPMLIVNEQFGSEYRSACRERSGILTSDFLENFDSDWLDHILQLQMAKKASFTHIHAGHWTGVSSRSVLELLHPFKDWLARFGSQLPDLDSITMRIYLRHDRVETAEDQMTVRTAIEDFVTSPKLMELKLITLNDAFCWDFERGSDSKKLLIHWTPRGTHKVTLIDPPKPYVETCCALWGQY